MNVITLLDALLMRPFQRPGRHDILQSFPLHSRIGVRKLYSEMERMISLNIELLGWRTAGLNQEIHLREESSITTLGQVF